jgi:hypothetical protein
MFKAIFDFIFRKKNRKRPKTMDSSIITEKTRSQIDKIWNNIDKMSGYGITILCLNTQEDDLAIALAHSSDFTIERFISYLVLNSKFNVIRLINKYKTTTSEEDGYRMKSHIIHLHEERFRKEKLI